MKSLSGWQRQVAEGPHLLNRTRHTVIENRQTIRSYHPSPPSTQARPPLCKGGKALIGKLLKSPRAPFGLAFTSAVRPITKAMARYVPNESLGIHQANAVFSPLVVALRSQNPGLLTRTPAR